MMRRVGAFLGPARPLPPRTEAQRALMLPVVPQQVPFDMWGQEDVNWCWAAVTQAIEGARRHQWPSQTQIATDHIARHLPNATCAGPAPYRSNGSCSPPNCSAGCTSMHWVSLVLAERGLLGTTLSSGHPIDLAAVQQQTAAGKPVVCRMDLNPSGHFLCLAGWLIAADGSPQVLVYDPMYGDPGRPVGAGYVPLAVVQRKYLMGSRYGGNNMSFAVN